MTDEERLREITGLAGADGGFSYRKGVGSAAEPTLLALMAFLVSGFQFPGLDKSRAWLKSLENPDGSLSQNHVIRPEGIWVTPHYAILHHLLGDIPSRDKAVGFLLAFKSVTFPDSDSIVQNNSLVGWAWVPGTFGWVEPTAWALLALKLAGKGDHPRCVEGRKLLMDRKIPKGGWNYGNATVYKQDLLPFFDTTALALLALRGFVPEADLAESLAILEASVAKRDVQAALPEERPEWTRLRVADESLYALSLIAICLEAFGRDPSGARQLLAEKFRAPDAEDFNLVHQSLGIIASSTRKVFEP